MRFWLIELAACSALGASQRGGYGAACSADDRCARACVRACSMRVAWVALARGGTRLRPTEHALSGFAQLAAKCFLPARRDVVAGRRPPRTRCRCFACLLVTYRPLANSSFVPNCARAIARRHKPPRSAALAGIATARRSRRFKSVRRRIAQTPKKAFQGQQLFKHSGPPSRGPNITARE